MLRKITLRTSTLRTSTLRTRTLQNSALRRILLLAAAALLAACASTPSAMVCEEGEGAMLAAIPGTEWQGCNGDCRFIDNDGLAKFECVGTNCPSDCGCRVFSRPARNWDGNWKDEGQWKEPLPQEKDASKRYRCWCVRKAG